MLYNSVLKHVSLVSKEQVISQLYFSDFLLDLGGGGDRNALFQRMKLAVLGIIVLILYFSFIVK